jgi:hypothetical protein
MKTVAGVELQRKQGKALLFGKSVDVEQHLEELKDGQKADMIRTVIPFQLKSLNDEDRTIEFVGSTKTEDRYGDVIEQAGWELGNFLKNPVIPWGHKYSDPPVAKALEVGLKEGSLTFVGKFASIAELCSDPANPSDYALFADSIYNAYKGGYLRAFSVGFRPLEYDGNWQDGYTFTKCELLEVSCVTVPANPEALVLAFEDGTFTEKQRSIWVKQAEGLIKSLTEKEGKPNNKLMEKQLSDLEDRVKGLETGIAEIKELLTAKKEEEETPPKKGDDDEEVELDEEELKSVVSGAVKGELDYQLGKVE